MTAPHVIDAKSGARGVLIDAATGRPVRWARRADLSTGEFEAFRIDPKEAERLGIPPQENLYRGRTTLRWVPMAPRVPSPPRRSDCEPLGEARRRLTPRGVLVASTHGECQERGCHARAEYGTMVEQVIDPEPGPDGRLYERAVMTEVRYFCARHYRPPVSVSARGVESEVDTPVRPE